MILVAETPTIARFQLYHQFFTIFYHKQTHFFALFGYPIWFRQVKHLFSYNLQCSEANTDETSQQFQFWEAYFWCRIQALLFIAVTESVVEFNQQSDTGCSGKWAGTASFFALSTLWIQVATEPTHGIASDRFHYTDLYWEFLPGTYTLSEALLTVSSDLNYETAN